MSDDDKTIPLTLAELRAVARKCGAFECDRLETKNGGLCDACSERLGLITRDTDDAPTARAVQARIDEASRAKWALEVVDHVGEMNRYVNRMCRSGCIEEARTWDTEAEALAWAEMTLCVGSCKVVRL